MSTRHIANRLKEFRLRTGLRQQDVAAKLGNIKVSRISNWEQGRCYATLPYVIVLAELYKADPFELYPGLTAEIFGETVLPKQSKQTPKAFTRRP